MPYHVEFAQLIPHRDLRHVQNLLEQVQIAAEDLLDLHQHIDVFQIIAIADDFDDFDVLFSVD